MSGSQWQLTTAWNGSVERQCCSPGLATSVSSSRRRGVSRRRAAGGEAYPKRFRELAFATTQSEKGVRLSLVHPLFHTKFD